MALAVPAVSAAQTAIEVLGARIGPGKTSTRFVLDLNASVSFDAFTLENPYRVVIDLPAVTWRLDPLRTPRGGLVRTCLLYTSPSPRDGLLSRMPSSA